MISKCLNFVFSQQIVFSCAVYTMHHLIVLWLKGSPRVYRSDPSSIVAIFCVMLLFCKRLLHQCSSHLHPISKYSGVCYSNMQ